MAADTYYTPADLADDPSSEAFAEAFAEATVALPHFERKLDVWLAHHAQHGRTGGAAHMRAAGERARTRALGQPTGHGQHQHTDDAGINALRAKLAASGYARSFIPFILRVSRLKLRHAGWFFDARLGVPVRVMPDVYDAVAVRANGVSASQALLDAAIGDAVARAAATFERRVAEERAARAQAAAEVAAAAAQARSDAETAAAAAAAAAAATAAMLQGQAPDDGGDADADGVANE
jgi:hypothetical protein